MTMTTSITSGQEKQYKRLVEDAAQRAAQLALEKVSLDNPSIQRLFEHGDELRTAIAELVVAKTRELSVSNQFADEETASNYVYPSGYNVKGITEQTNLLRQLFPGIGSANEELTKCDLPAGAEGYFAIPRWEKVAPTYNEAVEKVLGLIGKSRKFHNLRQGALGSQYLRQHSRTAKMFQTLGDQQKEHDILVIPAQFGLTHRGRSIRRAREVFTGNEVGFGAFAAGIMLLTHPERLVHYDNLWIDCPGDECDPDADGDFRRAPYFGFSDGELRFDTDWCDVARGGCGSASGLLAQ